MTTRKAEIGFGIVIMIIIALIVILGLGLLLYPKIPELGDLAIKQSEAASDIDYKGTDLIVKDEYIYCTHNAVKVYNLGDDDAVGINISISMGDGALLREQIIDIHSNSYINITLASPPPLPPGVVRVKVDSDNKIVEIDENNNEATLPC